MPDVLTKKALAGLFGTGFLQVWLVAWNTYQISHGHRVGVFIVGFAISFVWSFNVKRVAFGGWTERLTYAAGAGFGSLAGLLTGEYLKF